MQKETRTFHSVQLLRAIAASLVVLFHAHLTISRLNPNVHDKSGEYIFGFGASGVHIFFVISGFVMVIASNFQPSFDPRSFMARRLVRIFPIYWVCLVAYLGYHAFFSQAYALSALQTLGAFVLWPEYAADIIGPAWTLSYEMFFYLCFAAAMILGLKRGMAILAVTFVGLISTRFFWPPRSGTHHVLTNPLLLEFVGGAGVGYLYRFGVLPGRRWGRLLVVLSCSSFLFGLLYGYDSLPGVVVWGVPSVLLVLGVVAVEAEISASDFLSIAGRLGDSSYSLYLIHVLAIDVFVTLILRNGVKQQMIIEYTLIILVVCIVLGELLHRFVEVPMLRLLYPRMRSFLDRRLARVAGI